MDISIPEKVLEIISMLNDNGHEAFAVGGCVRDMILGRKPEDWDITTSALPQQVKQIFRRTVDTGIQHGTVTVLLDKEGFEVTTYRIDGEYEDSRHPKDVEFTVDLTEDLRRRDFTINAMAFNPTIGFIDEFGGMSDLRNRIIRCVGNPKDRFTEDALRMMRAVRFAAQLGFTIDTETKEAVRKLSENLNKISKERIQAELVKLITSEHPGMIRDMIDIGITKHILPELNQMMNITEPLYDISMYPSIPPPYHDDSGQNTKHHMYSVGEHSIKVMENVSNNLYLRLAALLHDIGKLYKHTTDKDGNDTSHGYEQYGAMAAKNILKSLKFDNKTINIVTRLIAHLGDPLHMDKAMVRKSIFHVGKDIYAYFIELREANLSAGSHERIQLNQEILAYVRKAYMEIISEKDCLSLKELAVTGDDLIALGYKPGKEIGTMLDALLEQVLEHPEYNHRDQLLRLLRRIKSPI